MDQNVRLRLTVKSAKELAKRDLFQYPSPFCRITIDGSANVIHTKVKNGSCEPEFNQSFDLSLTRTDSVTIQILDKNKVHKKPRKAFLGTVTLTSQSIKRLKDKGIHRHNLTNKDHPDIEVKGSLLFELKTRAKRSAAGTGLRTRDTSESTDRFSHVEGDYFRRDALHGPPLPRQYERCITQQGQVYWLNHDTGKRTWDDPRFDQNNVRVTGPLPDGWEEGQTASGRKYFINHRTKTTQFTDPRLENQFSTVRTKKTSLPEKLKMLRSDLLQLYGNSGNSREQETLLRIDINREDVFESSYRQILNIPTKYLRRRFLIRFKGEEGIDYGGVTREWLYLLSHSMLDPTYGLFEYCNEEIYTLEINPNSGINPEHLSYFTFIGKIIGIAIFHGHYLDGGFTLPFYKKILSIRLTLDDLESVDPELWNSLKWILNNDITDSGLDEQYFVVNYDSFGLTKEESLCPSGDQIKLNEENKKNYVEKYISWRFNKGTKEQFKALLAGLNAIVPIEFLKKQFDEKELELVITGLGKIDVLDWKSNSKYRNLTFDSELVVWWWEIVTEFADLERARLLQFATGSSRVPIAGFSALRGATNKDMNTIKLFTLVLVEVDSDSLPKAHTCFNRIDIPLYESKSKFKQKLMQAINETIGFHVD